MDRFRCFVLFGLLSTYTVVAFGQKVTAEAGVISFFSDAAIEDIKADNHMVGSLFNLATGDIVFIVKIKDFKFEKALMREHFNEKYMEIEKYPKSTFEGRITGFNPTSSGEQKVKALGKLSMHGVTREVEIPGVFQVKDGKVTLKSNFVVKLADYNIKIPKLIWQNLAEEVDVKIDFTYKSL
jgi:preprotein translocase subunit Sec61beta